MTAARQKHRVFHAGSLGLVIATASTIVSAQPAPPPDGVAIGDYWFRPRIEVRLRGEYFHHPVTTSGDVPVLGTLLGAPMAMNHQWAVHERTRLGLGVERGPLAAAVVVQDARAAGFPTPAGNVGDFGAATTSFHVAYLEAHSPETQPSFVRLGRQEVAWGEGRLLGISDWKLAPRSLDAVRGRWVLSKFDFEALAAILAPPGILPPELVAQAAPPDPGDSGTGAQLYGLDAKMHLDPLLHVELMGLGRVVRSPNPRALVPSDTAILDARLFGDRAGVGYAVELAYEFGRYAIAGGHRPLRAWAATAHVDWQGAGPLRPKLSLGGSYATGDDGTTDRGASAPARRFDPILPDARSGLGQMGLFAWSNVLATAFTATLTPVDEITIGLGYHQVRLADPHGAWFAASLLPVGQNAHNEAPFLGHEIDAQINYAPFEGLVLGAGYGAFVTGRGARTILSGRADGGPALLSAAYLQASFVAP